mmetsp:Transcript_7629/g.21828  ORF Transcript_7629/g.21828 Transcript_7629/m.21828 type:complete len:123 (-) Transcript_7629:63-431(-)
MDAHTQMERARFKWSLTHLPACLPALPPPPSVSLTTPSHTTEKAIIHHMSKNDAAPAQSEGNKENGVASLPSSCVGGCYALCERRFAREAKQVTRQARPSHTSPWVSLCLSVCLSVYLCVCM